jgi:hypothetical protein
VPLPPDLERKFDLEDRPVVIPDFDCHTTPRPVAMSPHRERASGLFLDGLDGGKFETFLVGGNFLSLSHVEILARHIHQTLPAGVSQSFATEEAEDQGTLHLHWPARKT